MYAYIFADLSLSFFQEAPSGETGSIMIDVMTGAAGKSGETVRSIIDYTVMFGLGYVFYVLYTM